MSLALSAITNATPVVADPASAIAWAMAMLALTPVAD